MKCYLNNPISTFFVYIHVPIIVCLMLLGLMAKSQTHDSLFIDGVIYYKLNDAEKQTMPDKKVLKTSELPYLQNITQRYGIETVQRPFFVPDNDLLMRTFSLKVNDFSQIDDIINELQHLPQIEYAERAPLFRIPSLPMVNNEETQNNSLPHEEQNNKSTSDPFYGDAPTFELNGEPVLYGNKWFLDQIQAEDSWELQTDNPKVTVAIVDNAIYTAHPDLKIDIQYDAANKDNDASPPSVSNTAAYGWSHGTHVIGLVSALTDNGKGIASIGRNLRLMAVRTAADNGSLAAFLEGVVWAIEHGADVISMSVGSPVYSITAQNVMNIAHDKGIILVAAAGNEQTPTPSYPAAYENVIAVASVNKNDQKSNFSNYGTWVDISAPGGNTQTTLNFLLSTTYCDASLVLSGLSGDIRTINGNTVSGKYHIMAGTSMATPIVAGLIGVLKSAKPDLLPQQAEALLKISADTINHLNINYINRLGAGRINAEKALETLKNNDLVAAVEADKTTIHVGGKVQFEDVSLGSVVRWEWEFEGGEPATSNQKQPTVEYKNAGYYDVKLTVFDGISSQTITKQQYINVGLPAYITEQATAFTQPLRGLLHVTPVNKDIAWASAYNGNNPNLPLREFTRTTDGGNTWQMGTVDAHNTLSLGMIHPFDDLMAWALLYPKATIAGGIYFTADGGKTWTPQTTAAFNFQSFPDIVYFWNATDGVCVGDPRDGYFEIYTTKDGGSNWSRVPNTNGVLNPLNNKEFGMVGFFSVGDDGSFFFNTTAGRIFRTTDKGKTWVAKQTPAGTTTRIAFANAAYGIIIETNTNRAFVTDDGGLSWKNLDYEGNLYRTDFKYIRNSGNVFVSCSATIGKTGLSVSYDRGKTWTESVQLQNKTQCISLGFDDVSTGWIGQFSTNATMGGVLKYQDSTNILSINTASNNPCLGDTVVFYHSSAHAVGSYEWDFGQEASPQEAYTAGPHKVYYRSGGKKDVSLVVNGNRTERKILRLFDKPFAGIISTTNQEPLLCGGSELQLTLDDQRGMVQWQYANKQNQQFTNIYPQQNTEHTWTTAPVFDTTFIRAMVSTGCTPAYSDTLVFNVSPIKADFVFNANNLDVQFMQQSLNAQSYWWDFGDTGTSNEPSPLHTYNHSGQKTVTLTVTNDKQCTHQTTKILDIYINSLPDIGSQKQLFAANIDDNNNVVVVQSLNDYIVVELYDLQGRLMIQKNIKAHASHTINMAHYTSGVYLLRGYNRHGVQNLKIERF